MNEERLRQLYGRGIAGRDARSELAGACAVGPERLLALVRRELPEAETLELLDEVMSSSACREAFELLRVVEAAGREAERADVAVQPAEVRPGTEPARGGALADSDGARPAGPPPAPLTLLGSSPATPPIQAAGARAADGQAMRSPWWRRNGASLALAASALIAVGLFTRDRAGGGEEVTRGAESGVALIAPATQPAAGDDGTTFLWHAVPGATRYEFELLGADGQPLHQATTSDTVVVLPADVPLLPGVEYRWLVRALTAGGQRSSPARPLLISDR